MMERANKLEQLGINIKQLGYNNVELTDVVIDILLQHMQRINHLEECLLSLTSIEDSDNWGEVKELTSGLFKTYGEANVNNAINQMVNTDYTQLGVDIGKLLDAVFNAAKKESKS